jgi:hypothetical protein
MLPKASQEAGEKMKAKVFGAYTYFFLGVILVASITFMKVPCPVSNGTGVVTGVKDLEIVAVDAELVGQELISLECGWDYTRYTYDVKISVVNETTVPVYGMVAVSFYDPKQIGTRVTEMDDEEITVESLGPLIAAFPVFVEIAAETARTIEETIVLEGISLDQFGAGETHAVLAATADEFVCPFDLGTGRVSITEWLRLR